jgi:hypothetical protein
MGLLKAILISFIFLAICSSISDALIFDLYDIDVNIVDDNGEPVERANVYISFEKNTSSGTKMYAKKSVTDSEGKFKASGSGNGHITYGATKEGYYPSHYTYDFPGQKNASLQKREFVILLRKFDNPVPMYAHNTRRSKIELPVIGKDVGFDLIAFDWVAPYGIGMKSDFIFYLERLPVVSRKNYDATLTITFTNRFDGIQPYRENLRNGSKLKLPKLAPEAGYQQKLVLHETFNSKEPSKLNLDFRADDLNYIFRVRSEEKDGRFERAIYGKIIKFINFTAMGSKTAEIYFTYYINPDYTRNLEFDPKRNLFGILPDLERVTEP